jgi:paraquat-inducible protein A
MRLLLPIVLLAASLSFALGIVLPLIQVERLFVFADEPSLVGMVAGLWREGDWLLAMIIALFSIAFPALKLALLHVAAFGGAAASRSLPAWLPALSKWSLLDVVLVALVVFAAKTSGLATALAKPGLWFFALSVLLTAGASNLVKRLDGATDDEDAA